MTLADAAPTDLPEGLHFHETLGLWAEGVVARRLAEHPVAPRPTKALESCTLDRLGGNTMLSMHLAQIGQGKVKCDHRHLDETVAYIVAGSGFSEFKQDDDAEPIRVDWDAGDLLVIPSNAWHRHVNTGPGPARQLSFRNSTFITAVLHGGRGDYHGKDLLYQQRARFYDRFADEPDYFTARERLGPARIRANRVARVLDEPLGPDDPDLGEGVAVQRYSMGGQRTLDMALLSIRAGGFVRPHRPLAEEAFVVLAGTGRTTMWRPGGAATSVTWSAGDLVSPPLGVWREHAADPGAEVRLLAARLVAIERALGVADDASLDPPLPDRFPTLLEAGGTNQGPRR